jgi:hypothetical protein
MMEAARTSETLVNFYQTTGRYNPEDSHLRYLITVFIYMRNKKVEKMGGGLKDFEFL